MLRLSGSVVSSRWQCGDPYRHRVTGEAESIVRLAGPRPLLPACRHSTNPSESGILSAIGILRRLTRKVANRMGICKLLGEKKGATLRQRKMRETPVAPY